MSTLHEQYATLLRRGMPEHPRVWTVSTRGDFYNAHYCGAVNERDYDSANGYFDTDDARDLIEAHARRWWLSLASDPDQKLGRALGLIGPGRVDSQLEAVLAATEHLEPAEK